MTKTPTAKIDGLWIEWGRLHRPYSAAGYGIRAVIEILRGRTEKAVTFTRIAAHYARERGATC